jgi:hypothetical protein
MEEIDIPDGTSSPLVILKDINKRAGEYFKRCSDELGPSPPFHREGVWPILPEAIKKNGQILTERLALLAMRLGPSIRHSPLLTEADETAVGHAIKGMRAALRFNRFSHWDIDVLLDEGTVLGVRRAGESEEGTLKGAEEAKTAFHKWSGDLQRRLELMNLSEGESSTIPVMMARSALTAGIRRDTAFIMMRISKDHPELEDVCNAVKRCFQRFGVVAVRSDDIEHEETITSKILDEIKTAEFLFADLSGERPSVYYEIGYAHALGKRVIMFRKAGTHIHFDLAAYNCPDYTNLSELEKQLIRRLEAVTGKKVEM